MYLTAQRVYSPSKKKSGINAFLYRHGAEAVPGMSWAHPRVEPVADQHVGTRGPEHIEIAPGGNRVVSFVDVVTADATPIEQIEAAVQKVEQSLSSDQLPLSTAIGVVAIRFGAQYGLPNAQLREEYEHIAGQALGLLRNPREPAWSTRAPLEVDVERTGEGFHFLLRSESKKRLAALHGDDWQAFRVSVSHETREAFEAVHGELFKNVVPVLADLPVERAAELGGMRFFDAHSGALLLEWPQR